MTAREYVLVMLVSFFFLFLVRVVIINSSADIHTDSTCWQDDDLDAAGSLPSYASKERKDGRHLSTGCHQVGILCEGSGISHTIALLGIRK